MLNDFSSYLERLSAEGGSDAAPDGPPGPSPGCVAFFDLDRTLIDGYSVTALAWERARSGSVSLRRIFSQAGVFIDYGLGRSDYHALLERTVEDLAGVPERDFRHLSERAYRRRVRGWIFLEARQLVEAHRRLGHSLVMVTSATRYQAEPVARELAMDGLCCTELEVVDGVLTGAVRACFGDGKRRAARSVARRLGTSLEDAYFYSDSGDDLPLLEAVGRPVVVNGKAVLTRLAAVRGWPQLQFERPGELEPVEQLPVNF